MFKKISRFLALLTIVALPAYYLKFKLVVPFNGLEIIADLAILAVIIAILRKELTLKIPPFVVVALFILIGVVFGVLVSADKTVALGIFKGWFVTPIFYGLAVFQLMKNDEKFVDKIVQAISLSVVLIGLYAILQYFGVVNLLNYQKELSIADYVNQKRALGYFESPNFLAMILAPQVMILFFASRRRWQDVTAIIIGLAAIYLSGSRGGMAGVLAGLTIGLLVSGRLISKKRDYLIVGVVILALIVAIVPHLATIFDSRLALWTATLDAIIMHPLTGIGPGQFYQYYQENYAVLGGKFIADAGYAQNPNNLYFDLWLSGGIVLIAAFVQLAIVSFKEGLKNIDNYKIAGLAALTAVLVHGIFDSTYFKGDLAIVFWLIIAMIFYKGELKQKAKSG